jgi:SNF2 family DNA or RNA helicase
MSPAQQLYYMGMEKLALIDIGKDTVTAVNAAGVIGKLLQISSGAAYKEGGGYALVDTGRYELIADLIEQRAHSVVFFNWTHQRDELVREFDKRGITFVVVDGSVSDNDRARAVADFEAGFYKVFLAHPQSAAHGLTLVKGTATIWASPTYNLEHFLQGNRRIYRAGQTQKTETIVVIAPNTIEEKVLERLTEKDAKQSSLLEMLKEMM